MITFSGMESSPQDVAMIGDDVNNDLGGGAKELGIQRLLGMMDWIDSSSSNHLSWCGFFIVQTGKYRTGDEQGYEGVRVFPSVVEAIEDVLQQHA